MGTAKRASDNLSSLPLISIEVPCASAALLMTAANASPSWKDTTAGFGIPLSNALLIPVSLYAVSLNTFFKSWCASERVKLASISWNLSWLLL